MSSERVVPLNNAEKAEESPYVAPDTERELRQGVTTSGSAVSENRTDRLLEREYPYSRRLGEMPHERAPKLHDTAQRVGTAVGKSVSMARELPRRVAEMKERFTVIRGRAREGTASTAHEIRENAGQRLQRAQTRAQYYANEYPVQFILGVGAAACVLGFFMRVWRSNSRA